MRREASALKILGKISVIALMMAFVCWLSPALNAQRSDAMIWASYALDKDLDKKTQFNFKTQGRMRENWSTFDYAFFDFGFSRKVIKGLKVDLAYVFNTKRTFLGKRHVMLPRHQVYGTVRYAFKFGPDRQFKFMNRNRLQTQLEDGQFDEEVNAPFDYFYRNKSTIRWRPNKTWMPYTSYEMYFRLSGFRANEPQIYRHRFSLGTYYYISKRRRIDVYYLYQLQQRRGQPDMRHAIGVSYERSLKSWKKIREKRDRKYAKKQSKEYREYFDDDDRDPFLKW